MIRFFFCILILTAPIILFADLNESLFMATYEGDLEQIKLLLSMGAEINARGFGRSLTPLHLSIEQKHFQIAKFLLENGAAINTRDNRGNTPLHTAAYYGNIDIISELLQHGADIEAKNDKGETPIFSAVRSGRLDIVKFLVSKNADINVENNDRTRIFDLAFYWPEIAKYLVSIGVDTDYLGFKPIHLACVIGDLNRVKSLISENNNLVNAQTKEGLTPLLLAIGFNNPQIVKFLIAKGASVNEKYMEEWTPLHLAVLSENFYIVQILIDKGAEINAKSSKGITPLHLACENGDIETAFFLISKGADYTICDNEGKTPVDILKSKLFRKVYPMEGGLKY